MRFLREWVLHNWALKLLALGLSFLLWTTYTNEPFAEIGYQVPVEFRNIPAELELSGDPPSQVHIRLRGRSALLRRLSPADLGISLDLSRTRPGEMLIRITPDQVEAPYGAQVVKISPSQLRVALVIRRASPPGP